MNRVGLTTFVTSAAHWSPGQALPPPTGIVSGPCRPGARLSETAIAFARSCSSGIETTVAFAGAGRASTETAIAFAGAKWVFLVQFSGAEAMPVSTVPCWGRAVVLLVSMSPRCRALCAKKFALCAHNGSKLACSGVLGEFFAEEPLEGCAGRTFSRTVSRGIPPGEHCRAAALAAGPSTGSVNPSMRSYTHLAEAGHGRPTRPQQPTPQRKALTKGKRLLVKAVTSLDNGRKWRVCAGHTLELLR